MTTSRELADLKEDSLGTTGWGAGIDDLEKDLSETSGLKSSKGTRGLGE